MKRIAVFASGKGSNAQELVRFFKNDEQAQVVLIVSNNPKAEVLKMAESEGIHQLLFSNEQLGTKDWLLQELKKEKIDFIVLAGFLRRIPSEIISSYKGSIINIHPALLPKFGGKGMYGSKVHEAVLQAGENESGITIHHVTEEYDEGAIIFQAKESIDAQESVESLARKIQSLEHRYFPLIVKKQIELCYP